MRERALINAIHRHLPKTLFRQGMTGAAMTGNGVPDYYYDGEKSDLWIEYKQLRSMPRNENVNVVALLTPQQWEWHNRRYVHGRNAFVIVGLTNRMALIMEQDGDRRLVAHVRYARTYKEVAAWICDFCGRS